MWEKNEDEKIRVVVKKWNISDSDGDYFFDSDKEYSKLVSESLNEECKGGIVESNDRESFDNDIEG